MGNLNIEENTNEIPISQLTICSDKSRFQREFGVGTQEEWNQFIKTCAISPGFNMTDDLVIEFIGTFAGKKDVIRIIEPHRHIAYCTPLTLGYYLAYNEWKSRELGEPVWIARYGDLTEIYKALRDHGIALTDDRICQDVDIEYLDPNYHLYTRILRYKDLRR